MQLVDGDELIALLLQDVDGREHAGHGRLVDVVRKDDRAVEGGVYDAVAHGIAVAVAPIERVDRPHDRGHLDLLHHAVVIIAVGRAKHHAELHTDGIVELLCRLAQLPRDLVVVAFGKLRVIVCMLRDLVSFIEGAAHCLFAAADTLADDEEGRARAALLQAVEQLLGIRARAVVKGQGNQFLLARRRGLHHRQQRHQTAQGQCYRNQAFHLLFLHFPADVRPRSA